MRALRGGGGRKLVTGHANGKMCVWADRECARVIDAHGNSPVRALTLRTTTHGAGVKRVEVVTAAAGGAARLWDVVKAGGR